MSMEEIIEKYKRTERRHSDVRLFGGYDFVYVNPSGALLAMAEWAREQSISFTQWVKKNYESSTSPDIWYSFARVKGEVVIDKEYTTEELYNLFIQAQQP